LSIFTLPPRPSSLAVVKGWFDDSRRDGICAVGGYAGADHRWEHFENKWPIVLEKHGVPYFHMKETRRPNGVYAKWLPVQDHRDKWDAFLGDLANVISESRLVFFGSIVRNSHLDRFNQENALTLEPYSLAAYGCMMMVAREHNETSELFFDHLEKVSSKLAKARDYAESDAYAEDFERMVTTALPKGVTFRELLAMQAADFMTWEFRKNHERIGEWFDIPNKPNEDDARWEHMEQWLATASPPRKSAAALVEGNQIAPIIWDYDRLCEAHRLRGGVWS
jgi:hypothetical protein